ncbi:MAG TPA: PadR family transcriptional regulator [Rhizomicrobium sp.]|nr:PadR family transcriptional regulator [Rhizomicrobium sp.]
MSSIRLFILSSFDAFGPMHGHRLRLVAEKMKVPLWTDISVGAVYGAMNRLAAEGLLREAGSEQEGNRPTRQLYAITEEGRRTLDVLRREGLSELSLKHDPFDLALTLVDSKIVKSLPSILATRLATLRAVLVERKRAIEEAKPNIGLAKQWALRHTEYRLEAEIAYLDDLIAVTKDIIVDERSAAHGKPKAR